MNPAVAAVTIFAIVVTKVVDLVRNAFDPGNGAAPWIWQVLAFTVGLVLAFVWHLNALEAISMTPAQGAVGQFLTGIGIGAAGSGYHELLDALSSGAKTRRAKR